MCVISQFFICSSFQSPGVFSYKYRTEILRKLWKPMKLRDTMGGAGWRDRWARACQGRHTRDIVAAEVHEPAQLPATSWERVCGQTPRHPAGLWPVNQHIINQNGHQHVDSRCVLLSVPRSQHAWCRGAQPKHVSNPAYRSCKPHFIYDTGCQAGRVCGSRCIRGG